MNQLRVLIADDHETVREGLKVIINAEPDMAVIGVADNGRAAVERIGELLPDVAVLDVSMPELNGLQATERIKQNNPQVKVVTLTRHTDDGYLQKLLKAGASGYVLKQSSSAVLVSAIRAVAAGQIFLDPVITEKVVGNYVNRAPLKGVAPQNEPSEREQAVLRMIAWGYSNKEIATRLELSVKTIEAHKSNAMQKLGMTGRIDIVRYAILQGWLQNT